MTDGPAQPEPDDAFAVHAPSWLRPAAPESRIPAVLAILSVITLQWAIPERYTAVPRWPLIVLEILLLLVILIANPYGSARHRFGTYASWGLIAAITVDNTTSAAVLDYRILSGQVSDRAAVLLGSGGAIYFTNVIVFGIWFWALDRGGPGARLAGVKSQPAFLFPQMTDPDFAPREWRPTFIDYLYVSFTNSVAFSPTDTMPLARWAKLMMAVQAIVATTTVALVFARAVSLLN